MTMNMITDGKVKNSRKSMLGLFKTDTIKVAIQIIHKDDQH